MLKFYIKIFMWWARHYQVSYPVCRQGLYKWCLNHSGVSVRFCWNEMHCWKTVFRHVQNILHTGHGICAGWSRYFLFYYTLKVNDNFLAFSWVKILASKIDWHTFMFFCHFMQRETTEVTVCLLCTKKPFQKESIYSSNNDVQFGYALYLQNK